MVLEETLSLLEYPSGPVLVDYPVDADEHSYASEPLACPVNFQRRSESVSITDNMIEEFQRELSTMQTWYDLASEKSTRSTPAVSGLAVQQIKDLFTEFINGKIDTQDSNGQKISDLLRLASEDLKAFYFKAVSAQPGQSTDVTVLADWFWGNTYAALCINEVRKICLTQETNDMQLAGKLLLIPRNQMHRFEE